MNWSNFIEVSRHVISAIMNVIATPVPIYYVAISSMMLVLTGQALWDSLHHNRRKSFAGPQEAVSSQLAQGVSVIVPDFNEEAVIVTSVGTMTRQGFNDESPALAALGGEAHVPALRGHV